MQYIKSKIAPPPQSPPSASISPTCLPASPLQIFDFRFSSSKSTNQILNDSGASNWIPTEQNQEPTDRRKDCILSKEAEEEAKEIDSAAFATATQLLEEEPDDAEKAEELLNPLQEPRNKYTKICFYNTSFGVDVARVVVPILSSVKDQLEEVNLLDFIAGRLKEEALEVMIMFSSAIKGSDLKYLNPLNNTLGEKGARAFSDLLSFQSNLEKLHLMNKVISEEAAKAVCKLSPSTKKLKVLYFHKNMSGDEGAIAISELLKESLAKINLSENELKDEGALVTSNAFKEEFSLLIAIDPSSNQIWRAGIKEYKSKRIKRGVGGANPHLWFTLYYLNRNFKKDTDKSFDKPHVWHVLVDLTRQVWANDLFPDVIEASESNGSHGVVFFSEKFLEFVDDMNTLLAGHDRFLLRPWLESSKQPVIDKELETRKYNRRIQIAIWFDNMEEGVSLLRDEVSTQEWVKKWAAQIRNLDERAKQDPGKENLNERVAKLSGGVAVIQVGCTLWRLAATVDAIKDTFDIEGQKVATEIGKETFLTSHAVESVVEISVGIVDHGKAEGKQKRSLGRV